MKFLITVRLASGQTDESEVEVADYLTADDPIMRQVQIRQLLKPIADDMIARLTGAEWVYEAKPE